MAGARYRRGTLPATVVRWAVLATVVLGLARPRDLVWCHAGPGHSEVEELEAGCCGSPSWDASCARPPAGPHLSASEVGAGAPDSRDAAGVATDGQDGCTDVYLGAHARHAAGVRLASPAATSLLRASPEHPSPGQFCDASTDRLGAARAAARELSLSVVLRA